MTISADDAGVVLRGLHLRILRRSLLQLLLESAICQGADHGSAIILFTANTSNSLALPGLRCRDRDRIGCLDCIPLSRSCHLSVLWTQLGVRLYHLDSSLIVIILDVIEATWLIEALQAAYILNIAML